jgi:hypothetical protein
MASPHQQRHNQAEDYNPSLRRRIYPTRCTIKHMTADERTIANAALGAGAWENHDQIVIAVAHLLGLEPQHAEAVLQRLRIRMILVCVSAANAGNETASVRYERGMDWEIPVRP